MSSDVYVDFENGSERIWFRIGHLATMNYFWNFLDEIEKLQEKYPTVTNELISELISLGKEYEREIPRSFDLMKKTWVDTEDYWRSEYISDDLSPYLGWSWNTRVD